MAESNWKWKDEISDEKETWPRFAGALMQTPSVPAGIENFEKTLNQPMLNEASNSLMNENVTTDEPMSLSDDEIKSPPGTGSGSVVQSGRNKGRGNTSRCCTAFQRCNSVVPFRFNRANCRAGGQGISGNAFRVPVQGNMQPGVVQHQGFRYRSSGEAASNRAELPQGRGDIMRGRGDCNRGRGDFIRGRGMNLNIGLNPEQEIHPMAMFDPAADERITNMMNNFSLLYIGAPMFPPNNSDQN